MLLHDTRIEKAIRFSRFDQQHLLSTASAHSFMLEDRLWPTAEHYYQAHKFEGSAYAESIVTAATAQQAYQAGNRWFKRKVNGWKAKRRLWMTRALYRKALEHEAVRDALLATADAQLIETSLYDHYWGIGRDQRGENMLGKVWMDIREKITAGRP
ncbi:MAG: NADAR family protein [Cellvibrionaceae bacterium]|nr:NADAR family protein [Cellvibrionaceae bacterium]